MILSLATRFNIPLHVHTGTHGHTYMDKSTNAHTHTPTPAHGHIKAHRHTGTRAHQGTHRHMGIRAHGHTGTCTCNLFTCEHACRHARVRTQAGTHQHTSQYTNQTTKHNHTWRTTSPFPDDYTVRAYPLYRNTGNREKYNTKGPRIYDQIRESITNRKSLALSLIPDRCFRDRES